MIWGIPSSIYLRGTLVLCAHGTRKMRGSRVQGLGFRVKNGLGHSPLQ